MTPNASTDAASGGRLDGVLPFGEFLRALRRRGLGIDVGSFAAVARLLERWEGVDRDQLRDAMAALLARDEREVAIIRGAFEEWFPRPAEPPRPRSWRMAAAAVLVVAALSFAATRSTIVRETAQPPPGAGTPIVARAIDPAPVPPPRVPPTPEPRLPPEPHQISLRNALVAGGAAAFGVFLAGVAWRGRRRRRTLVREQRRELRQRARGPFRYRHPARPDGPVMPREWIEDFATIVGRGLEEDQKSDTLDVDESLRMTLSAGLHPFLVFEAPPRNQPVVILEDRGGQMRPWRRKVDFFVEELRRQRIAVEHWVFNSDPRFVWREPAGRPITLRDLAAATGDRSLLVMTTGDPAANVLAGDDDAAAMLRRWRLRTCLTPIANPAYWPADIDALPMRVWPMTRNGLRGAAWEIAAADRIDVSTVDPVQPRAVTRGDLERMKRLIALTPRPTVALADELRRRFCPDIPEEVVLFLAAEGVLRGDALHLSDNDIRQLLADERREAPLRELQVRRYLLAVMRDAEPPRGSVAHQRWEIDSILNVVQVAHLQKADAADAVATLAQLASGELHAEVASAVDAVADEQLAARLRRVVQDAAERFPGNVERRFVWTAPGLVTVALSALIGLVVFDGFRKLFPQAGQIIPHQRGAYIIDDDKLRVEMWDPQLPTTLAAVYVDGTPRGVIDVLRNPDLTRFAKPNSWIQLRSRLSAGNWATSNGVYVWPDGEPPPDPPRPRALSIILRVLGNRGRISGTDALGALADVDGVERLITVLEEELGVDIRSEAGLEEMFRPDRTLEQVAAFVESLPAVERTHGRITVRHPQRRRVAFLATHSANRGAVNGVTELPRWMLAGDWSISIAGEGVQQATVVAGRRATVDVLRPATSGRLRIALPAGVRPADVIVLPSRRGDDRRYKYQPDLELPSGSYTLVLKSDFREAVDSAVVRVGETSRIAFKAVNELGIADLILPPGEAYENLRVSGADLTEVSADPAANRYRLRAAAGTYVVEGGSPQVRPVTVVVANDERRTYDFREMLFDAAMADALKAKTDQTRLAFLREADSIRPNQPDVILQIATALVSLGLQERAELELRRYKALGSTALLGPAEDLELRIKRPLRTAFTYSDRSRGFFGEMEMMSQWKRTSPTEWTENYESEINGESISELNFYRVIDGDATVNGVRGVIVRQSNGDESTEYFIPDVDEKPRSLLRREPNMPWQEAASLSPRG